MKLTKRNQQYRRGSQIYRAKHRLLGLCQNCPNQRLDTHNFCFACLQKQRERYARLNRKNGDIIRETRLIVLNAYGMQCECCDEHEPEFLTVEHKKLDGALHRRKMGSTIKTYQHIIAQNFPKDLYGVLCMNCNWAKRRSNICPHKLSVTTTC